MKCHHPPFLEVTDLRPNYKGRATLAVYKFIFVYLYIVNIYIYVMVSAQLKKYAGQNLVNIFLISGGENSKKNPLKPPGISQRAIP